MIAQQCDLTWVILSGQVAVPYLHQPHRAVNLQLPVNPAIAHLHFKHKPASYLSINTMILKSSTMAHPHQKVRLRFSHTFYRNYVDSRVGRLNFSLSDVAGVTIKIKLLFNWLHVPA